MKSLLKLSLKAIDRLTTFGAVIGGALIAVMTAIVTIAVIARYVLSQPIGWSEEVSIYLMIWGIFLGTAFTLKHDAHIGVDLLMSRLSHRAKRFFHCFQYLVGLAFMSILLVKGIGMIKLSLMLDSRSIATDFPLYLIQLSVPVGAVLLMLQLVSKFVHLFDSWNATEKAEP
jgi:TRAP-type C4-dicarboxylate transport system permease small subunit